MLPLVMFFLSSVQAAPAESIRIEHFSKDPAGDHIILNGNTLEYNGTSKQLPEVISDKYRNDILHEFPLATKAGEEHCPPNDRWLLQIGKSSRDYCHDEKAIAFLKKMVTKVKVIIR